MLQYSVVSINHCNFLLQTKKPNWCLYCISCTIAKQKKEEAEKPLARCCSSARRNKQRAGRRFSFKCLGMPIQLHKQGRKKLLESNIWSIFEVLACEIDKEITSHLQLASTWKIKQHFGPPHSKNCVNHSTTSVRNTTSSGGATFSTGNQCIRTPRCMIAGINLNKTGVVTWTKISHS